MKGNVAFDVVIGLIFVYLLFSLYPASEAGIRFNHLLPDPFANGLMSSIDKLENKSRNHVFLYIHGFQPFSSLKLDLFSGFVNNYMNHPKNKIAKVLFFVWPAQGLSRKRADDRAIESGRNFTKNQLFDTLKHLSDRLEEKNMFLNLVVHSFGHQLLNGMLEHFDCKTLSNKPIFKNVFLMASDVTHLALNQTSKETGFDLPNFFGPITMDSDFLIFFLKEEGWKTIINMCSPANPSLMKCNAC
jgi:hypothetical protein